MPCKSYVGKEMVTRGAFYGKHICEAAACRYIAAAFSVGVTVQATQHKVV